MRKCIYKIYNKLFNIIYFNRYRYKILQSYIFIKGLRYSTEYVIEKWLENLYDNYKSYDGKNTMGMLQFPRHLREISIYSYLYNRIFMGYHPTLSKNPISLERILKLNKIKDKKYSKFLSEYLTYHWNNIDKSITKNKLEIFIKND